MSHWSEKEEDPDFPSANEDEHHYWECNETGCSSTFDGVGGYRELWEKAKKLGWICYKNTRDVWVHFCPDHRTRSKKK